MATIKWLILAGALIAFVGCNGTRNKNENENSTPSPTTAGSPAPDKRSKPLETPCKGKLLVRHAYSECGPDHFWHVVEDDYFDCPPVKVFRVLDTKTQQKCEIGGPPPEGLGSPYRDIKDICPNPKDTGDKISVTECFHGQWRTATYSVYVCQETGAKGIHKDHPDSVIEHHKSCSEPIPPFTPPSP